MGNLSGPGLSLVVACLIKRCNSLLPPCDVSDRAPWSREAFEVEGICSAFDLLGFQVLQGIRKENVLVFYVCFC